MGRRDLKSNDPDESYTRKSVGRKEVRTFLKQFSLVTAYTGGDDVRKAEERKGVRSFHSTQRRESRPHGEGDDGTV